jgi:hypothetical protein
MIKVLLHIATPVTLLTGLFLFQLSGIRLEFLNIDWIYTVLSLSAFIIAFLQVGFYLENIKVGSFSKNLAKLVVSSLIVAILSGSVYYFLVSMFFRIFTP